MVMHIILNLKYVDVVVEDDAEIIVAAMNTASDVIETEINRS